jgi:hypothetical protein
MQLCASITGYATFVTQYNVLTWLVILLYECAKCIWVDVCEGGLRLEPYETNA